MAALIELAKSQIEMFAKEQGFQSVGFVRADDADRFPEFCTWLEHGYNASMDYLKRRMEAYRNPKGVLEHCQTLIVLTLPYQAHPWTESVTKQGRERSVSSDPSPTIGSYAMPTVDYHGWIRRKLKPLTRELRRMFPDCHSRVVVDTAPLLERHYASKAGLGWIGKNTMLLKPDAPFATQHCGTCRACLDACPTQAFPAPYQLDATRCISYWTIESRSIAPESLRPALGDWVWGCDICQEVCPWNRKPIPTPTDWLQGAPAVRHSDLVDLLSIDETTFRARYANSPMLRAGWSGIVRNAALAAGNRKLLSTRKPLMEQLKHAHPDSTQEAIRWALGRIESSSSQEGESTT